jgi:hypothetical protein
VAQLSLNARRREGFKGLTGYGGGSAANIKKGRRFAAALPQTAFITSSKEALINSLFAFILEFLCNARNGTTRIASYLRSLMTQQCIKILIKANSMN